MHWDDSQHPFQNVYTLTYRARFCPRAIGWRRYLPREMSSTPSMNGRRPSGSKTCAECRGVILDRYCVDCGLCADKGDVFDHNPYSRSGDRHEVLDRSSNASVGPENRDYSGKKVPHGYMSRLRSTNRSEKRSRPYNPDRYREGRFKENILPHIRQLRSTVGDDAMMASFRELYDALIGQSELLRKKRLKLTNVLRTSYDNRMVSRALASVIVHELERDARPLSQKLSDSNPYKYATSKNSNSEDFAKIMMKIKSGWEEWTDYPMESISAFTRSLLRFINNLYTPSKGGDVVIRRKRGIDDRERQLEAMLKTVCEATPGIPNMIPESVLNSLFTLLSDATDPEVDRYPMMDTAPNHLMTCQIELVLQVLQYLYPGSKMKHPKVVRTLKEGSNLNLSSSSCNSRSYRNFVAGIISKLEALS